MSGVEVGGALLTRDVTGLWHCSLQAAIVAVLPFSNVLACARAMCWAWYVGCATVACHDLKRHRDPRPCHPLHHVTDAVCPFEGNKG